MVTKIIDVEIYRFALPLVKPLRLMGQEITRRHGLLIRFRSDNGFEGWGEIAPFPGLHRETLREAEQQICALATTFSGKTLPKGLEKLDGSFENLLKSFALYPSTQFGVEMAILNLMAASRKIYLSRLLTPDPVTQIPLNALLTGTKEEMLQRLTNIAKEKHFSLKIKVGRLSLEDEVEVIRLARKSLPVNVTLRLDANRCWNLKEAINFAKIVGNDRIEYIEEPLKKFSELSTFHNATGIALALDESLLDLSPQKYDLPSGVIAFILKPAVLGGIEKTLRFVKLGQQHGIKSVISSVFESGVGLTTLANIAAAINKQPVPIGLDTYKWLKKDVLQKGFQATGGQVHLKILNENARGVKMSALKQVFVARGGT